MLRTPPSTALNTYFLTVTTSPVQNLSPNLMKVDYISRYGSARYLLAFSGIAVPADGSVPIVAPLAVAANGSGTLSFTPIGLPINSPGLVLVVSSTAATLTKDVSATYDFSAVVEEWEMQNPSASTVGDLTTGVSMRQIWADSAGPKHFKRAQIKNVSAVDLYAVLYAVDAPAASSKMIATKAVPANTNIDWHFGLQDGVVPFQKNADGTYNDGCTVAAQVTLTAGAVTTTGAFNILGTYAS